MTKKGYILMEDGHKIDFELFENEATKTVEKFEKLVNDKFYDGLTFHRVIDGFVSKGGCAVGTGTGPAGYQINGQKDQNTPKQAECVLSRADTRKDTGSSTLC